MTEDTATRDISPFDQFQETLAQLKKPEEKIRLCLDFMRGALSEKMSPRFRDFWESKKVCLPFFKESLPISLRSRLWSEYIEISSEGKHLKDMLDEQSSFIIEQLELAISALEQDLSNKDLVLKQLSENAPDSLPKDYQDAQKELYWLNTMAARINGFRKEIMKTEMRARVKNKFFERLSKVGDSVFPRRKELIKQVSEQFLADVQAFANASQDDVSPFAIKADIKAFQSSAKNLTLDTHSFNEARTLLSGCWDKLKEKEDAFRKEKLQKQEEFRQTLEKVSKEQEEKNHQLETLQRQKREKMEALRSEIQAVLDSVSEMSLDKASALRESLQLKTKAFNLSSAEREVLESLLKKLRDKILDKKELALSNLSEEEQKSLNYLREKLAEGQSQRSEIKMQIESYRRVLSSSGFDFEKAINYRDMIESEKARLDKVCGAIEDIEDKISALEDAQTCSL